MPWDSINETVKFYDLEGNFVTELDIPIISLTKRRFRKDDPIIRCDPWSGEADIPDDHGLEGEDRTYLVEIGTRFKGKATVRYLRDRYEVPAHVVIWGEGPLTNE